jgi:hypothetical protein
VHFLRFAKGQMDSSSAKLECDSMRLDELCVNSVSSLADKAS